MKNNIENNIKELTHTKKIVDFEEICDYVNEECFREFNKNYYFTCSELIDEGINEEFIDTIEENEYSYNIYKSHIEVSRNGFSPLIVEWYNVDKLNKNEEILEDYYFL